MELMVQLMMVELAGSLILSANRNDRQVTVSSIVFYV